MAQIQTSTWSETAASNNAATPDGWPEGQTAASVNNCAREMMAALKQWYNREHLAVTAGGTADALTLTYTVAPTAYTFGMKLHFLSGASANTGAATINVNGLGAKNIVRMDGSTALVAGNIPLNSPIEVIYDGTSFRLSETVEPFTASATGGAAFLLGLQLRWGSGNVGAAGDTAVSYSSAFPTETLQVLTALNYSVGVPLVATSVAASNFTASGFTLGSSAALGYVYLAIGR